MKSTVTKARAVSLVAMVLLGCAGSSGDSDEPAADQQTTAPPTVVLETNLGDIVVELYPDSSPETVANFLRYVRSGFYDGLIFHRVLPDRMIQAGVATEDLRRRVPAATFPIANEAQNGLKNLRGTIAMARTSDPHSATTEFFINLFDNAVYDYTEPTLRGWGYAVFGRVVSGMEVVDSVAGIPTSRRGRYGDLPTVPTTITRARVQ